MTMAVTLEIVGRNESMEQQMNEDKLTATLGDLKMATLDDLMMADSRRFGDGGGSRWWKNEWRKTQTEEMQHLAQRHEELHDSKTKNSSKNTKKKRIDLEKHWLQKKCSSTKGDLTQNQETSTNCTRHLSAFSHSFSSSGVPLFRSIPTPTLLLLLHVDDLQLHAQSRSNYFVVLTNS